MKRFKFKLQGLLRIKQSMEREVRFELIEIQGLCEKQKQKIAEAETKIQEWSLYYNAIMKRGGNATQLAVIDHHVQNLYRYREQLNISLDVLNREKEDVTNQYNDIKREVKTIEHLRDKKKSEYLLEVSQEEAKFADEMAAIRHVREKVVA